METLEEYLKNELEFNDAETKKTIENLNIRNIKLIKQKILDYQDILGVSKTEIAKMIKSFPFLLGYDTKSNSDTSVKTKIEDYQEILGVSKTEIAKMFKSFPSLLSYDTKSTLKIKIEKLKNIGIEAEDLVNQPMLLGVPFKSIKIRYMLKQMTLFNNNVVNSKQFLMNEKKIYARLKYLGNQSRSIYHAKKQFETQHHITDEELIK